MAAALVSRRGDLRWAPSRAARWSAGAERDPAKLEAGGCVALTKSVFAAAAWACQAFLSQAPPLT